MSLELSGTDNILTVLTLAPSFTAWKVVKVGGVCPAQVRYQTVTAVLLHATKTQYGQAWQKRSFPIASKAPAFLALSFVLISTPTALGLKNKHRREASSPNQAERLGTSLLAATEEKC